MILTTCQTRTKAIVLITSVFFLISNFSNNRVYASSDFENTKLYGLCEVSNIVDWFTDDTIYRLICPSTDYKSYVQIVILPDGRSILMFKISDDEIIKQELSIENSSDTEQKEQTLKGKYRFDKGVVKNGTFYDLLYSNTTAAASFGDFSTDLTTFLNQFANARRIVFAVEDKAAKIYLNDSKNAVKDFVKRIEHLNITDGNIGSRNNWFPFEIIIRQRTDNPDSPSTPREEAEKSD